MNNDFQAPVNIQASNEELLRKWTEYTIEQFHLAMQKAKIGRGDLWDSFEKELISSNGNVDEVIIKFLQYGRFVDMGAGRGYTLGEQKLNRRFDVYRNTEGKMVGRHARLPKKWYSKTYMHQVHRLREIYQETFGQQLVQGIENSLRGSINLNA